MADPSQGLDRAESLGRAWVVRQFLETDEAFTAPEGVGHWLGMDAVGFHGIALPADVLVKIYRANLERVFGPVPAPLDRDAALAEQAQRFARWLEGWPARRWAGAGLGNSALGSSILYFFVFFF